MSAPRFAVSVKVQRFVLAHNRWATEQWRPVAAIPSITDAQHAAGRIECVEDSVAGTTWCFDGWSLELHASESEGYYLNVTSDQPKVFVMWRMDAERIPPAHPVQLTVSYNEAGRFLDGGEQVEAVPMSAEIRAWTQAFVAEHYKPEPRRKSRRNDLYERDPAAGAGGRRR